MNARLAGAALCLALIPFAQAEVIVDDPDATPSGSWLSAGAANQAYEGDSLYAVVGGGADSIDFAASLPANGTYIVEAWNSCYTPRANAVPHVITHADGQTQVDVDQDAVTGVCGRWQSLGKFRFEAGTPASVTISDSGVASGSYIGADAVRFSADPADLHNETLASLLIRCDGPAGGQTFTDDSVHGVYVDNITNNVVVAADGREGNRCAMTGGGLRMRTADGRFDMGRSDFTVDAWIRTTNSGATSNVILQGPYNSNGNGWDYYGMWMNSGYFWFYMGHDASLNNYLQSSTLVNDGNWHHVAATREGNQVRLFVDGNLEDQATVTFGPYPYGAFQGAALNVGSDHTGQVPFHGDLDEVRMIKGRALWTGNFDPNE